MCKCKYKIQMKALYDWLTSIFLHKKLTLFTDNSDTPELVRQLSDPPPQLFPIFPSTLSQLPASPPLSLSSSLPYPFTLPRALPLPASLPASCTRVLTLHPITTHSHVPLQPAPPFHCRNDPSSLVYSPFQVLLPHVPRPLRSTPFLAHST